MRDFEIEAVSNDERQPAFWTKLRAHRETVAQEQDEEESISKRKWSLLLFGQVIALGMASMNAASFVLEYHQGVVVPIFLLCINYAILSIHLWFLRQKQRIKPEQDDNKSYALPLTGLKLSAPWYSYLVMSILDVEANYILLLSLEYTSLTSTTLLGSLNVPSTMLTSRLLLARVFGGPHFLGVLLCLLGGTMTFWLDLGSSSTDNSNDEPLMHPHSYFGDALAVTSAILYGLGDTVAELFCKHVDRVEYLAMLGLFGAILTGIQFPLLEWHALQTLILDTPLADQLWIVLFMLWYLVSLLFYYVASTLFYIHGDATLLNLSLQSSNMWAILFTVVAEGQFPSPLFFLAVLLVVSGVFVYELGGSKHASTVLKIDGDEEASETSPLNIKPNVTYSNNIK